MRYPRLGLVRKQRVELLFILDTRCVVLMYNMHFLEKVLDALVNALCFVAHCRPSHLASHVGSLSARKSALSQHASRLSLSTEVRMAPHERYACAEMDALCLWPDHEGVVRGTGL